MLYVRQVTTGSGAKAVQVIRYAGRRTVVVRHIGSAHTEREMDVLYSAAYEWIEQKAGQFSMFPDLVKENVLPLDYTEYLGICYTFIYETMHILQQRLGYTGLNAPLLNDLVTIRIMEPASKLRSIELIETYFGIKHRRQSYYESAPNWLGLKQKVEKLTIRFAEQEFCFNYTLLFYDVTTLYFEAFESDELRKTGFSKDNKSQQPQILIGLMVSKEGFPVAYELFPGNTFEGHTLLPVIKSFINKHNVKDFTVVADAAMISSANVQELKKENIHYIVGARLGNVSTEIVRQIDQQLPREDGKMIRLNTSNGFLICGYSQQRFKKDKFEMQKQIEKANHLIKNPAKNRRVKFIKTESNQMELNTSLIAKTTMLLGVKGYYSDLPENIADNKTIIKNYHDLYKVEQAFRISKHDLQSRPIFHFKEDPIRLHILICFMSLAISRYIELKTGASIRAFLTMSKKVTDARLFNKITQKAITLRSKMEDPLPLFLEKLRLPY